MEMMTPTQIKKLRKALSLTPTELAAKVGVTENAVRRWEIGDRHPRTSSLILLRQLADDANGQFAGAQ